VLFTIEHFRQLIVVALWLSRENQALARKPLGIVAETAGFIS
jgi:hypothetical protein